MISILKNKKGFTLVEVLLALSIIAIVATLVIPRFINLKRTANTAKIAGDLRIIDAAINQYYLEHRKYPPTVEYLPSSVLVTSGKYFISMPKPPAGEYYVSSTVGGIGKVSRYLGAPNYAIIAAHETDNILRRGALYTGNDNNFWSTAEFFSDFKSLSSDFNV